MRINRGLLNWGVFLVVLGAVPLAVRWGALDASVAGQLLRLWPLILIGLGLGLMLRFSQAAALGGVIVAATAGLLLGAVLAGGSAGISGACVNPNRATGPLETRSSPFAGNEARLDIELSCVDLTVDAAGAGQWLVRADFSNGQPRLDMEPGRVQLRDRAGGFLGDADGRAVQVSLPSAPQTSLDITLNASSATVDPGSATLSGVGGTLNASDMRLDLGDSDMSAGGLGLTLNASSGTLVLPRSGIDGVGITLNAASLTVCVDPSLGLAINASETLSSNNFAQAGLTRSGDRWTVAGSGPTITIGYTGNVSSITLDRSGGCQ
jgi:hypothetical protein